MFHTSEGLFFTRIVTAENYGGVKVTKHETGNLDSPIVFEKSLTADEWASVTSSMSALGENGTTWRIMREFQK